MNRNTSQVPELTQRGTEHEQKYLTATRITQRGTAHEQEYLTRT